MDLNTAYTRALLRRTWEDVKRVAHPTVRARDMAVARTSGRGQFFCQLPNRAAYFGGFDWEGDADNAYDAKAKAWSAFLVKNFPEEGDAS